jgi:hypothetical protein
MQIFVWTPIRAMLVIPSCLQTCQSGHPAGYITGPDYNRATTPPSTRVRQALIPLTVHGPELIDFPPLRLRSTSGLSPRFP